MSVRPTRRPRFASPRRLAALAVAVAVAALGVAGAASPASAAGGGCMYMNAMYGANIYDEQVYIPWATDGVHTVSCYLAVGAVDSKSSTGVKALQHAWNVCYKGLYEPNLVEDGRFGANTKSAVQRIQRAEGLTIDGIMGTQTKMTMLWPVVNFDTGKYLGRCESQWA